MSDEAFADYWPGDMKRLREKTESLS